MSGVTQKSKTKKRKRLYFLALLRYNKKRERKVTFLTKAERLDYLLNEDNGYLIVGKALTLDVSKTYVREYIQKRGLVKVAHGIYKSDEVWDDDLYVLGLRNEKMIYSHDTALMLQGLTEREPSRIYVSVPQGYNATHLRKNGIEVHQVKVEHICLGITEAITVYGNKVVTYDMERSICDLLKVRNDRDTQMFSYALKEYVKRNDKNLSRLTKYAEILGVSDDLRLYMAVLL